MLLLTFLNCFLSFKYSDTWLYSLNKCEIFDDQNNRYFKSLMICFISSIYFLNMKKAASLGGFSAIWKSQHPCHEFHQSVPTFEDYCYTQCIRNVLMRIVLINQIGLDLVGFCGQIFVLSCIIITSCFTSG